MEYGIYYTEITTLDVQINIKGLNPIVDFKSHYNKTKISEMDISNIYLKNESFEIFSQDGVKLVG